MKDPPSFLTSPNNYDTLDSPSGENNNDSDYYEEQGKDKDEDEEQDENEDEDEQSKDTAEDCDPTQKQGDPVTTREENFDYNAHSFSFGA